MRTFLEYSSIKGDANIHIDEDGNLFDINDDSVVEKLNAYVGSIGVREYLNPEAAVNELRQKLMRIGLHFGDVQFTGESGEMSMPIIARGGKFGKELDTPMDEFMDEPESGRSINFVFERLATGTHKVFAQIS